MNKPKCYIYAPVDTLSGYGANSRNFIKALIELKGHEWEIKIISCNWGDTPLGFIKENHDKWGFIEDYIVPQIKSEPDYMIWITIPSEAQPIGKFNILITAGIETDVCDHTWIEGCNRMDLVITSSEHSKEVFETTSFTLGNKNNPGKTQELRLETPVEVLFEGVDLNTFFIDNKSHLEENELNYKLDQIPNDFVFLFVGTWLKGDLGNDRKNIAKLILNFYNSFKNRKNKPALLLKTNIGYPSNVNQRIIQERINQIKSEMDSNDLPDVYLIDGNFSDKEMNLLYNHPKIKAMISLTKGEGFGRPLLEFSVINKPIICSNWSGPRDFLNEKFTSLIPGGLNDVHPSCLIDNMIIEGSKWFEVHSKSVKKEMRGLVKNYDKKLELAKRLGYQNRNKFSYEKMKELLLEILNKHVDFD